MTNFERSTEKILDFLSMVPTNSANLERFDIDMITGKSEVRGLINNKAISIAQSIISNDASGDWHTHPETEHIILYEGGPFVMEMQYKDGNQLRTIDMTKSCYIEPNIPHRLHSCMSDSKCIAVIIPGTNTFPKETYNGEW